MKGVYITGIFESFERYILKDEYFSFFFTIILHRLAKSDLLEYYHFSFACKVNVFCFLANFVYYFMSILLFKNFTYDNFYVSI